MQTEFSCSAVDPIRRAMECIPENEFNNENAENENPLITSIKSMHRSSMQKSSDATTRLKSLTSRLEAFWSKGWLSRKEYQQHLDFLSTFDVSCMGSNGKYALRELEKEFDTMEEHNSEPASQSWSDMFMSGLGMTTSNKATSNAGLSSFWNNSMMATSHDDDEESSDDDSTDDEGSTTRRGRPLANATSRVVNGARKPTIVHPRDLANVLTEHAVSDLFVETCFFARLGFAQPPCCMSCTYKEAMKGNIPNMNCTSWVVWRKNANRTFDPSNNANIGTNALVIQCKSARKLSSGMMVEGYQWEAREKMLLRRKQ